MHTVLKVYEKLDELADLDEASKQLKKPSWIRYQIVYQIVFPNCFLGLSRLREDNVYTVGHHDL